MENEKRNRNRSLLSGFALTHENWLHWHYVASHMDMEHTLVDWGYREWPCGVYQPRRATPVWHPERAHCHMRSHGDSRQMDRDPLWPAADHAGSVFVVRRCKPARRKEQREREGGERDSTCLNNEQWIRAIVNQSQTNQPTFVMVAAFISRVPVSVAKAACSCCMKSCSRRRVRARSIISSRFPAAVGSMLKP